ncbi:MAG: AIR synthase-related protein [Gemmatimonadota bacterium]
MIIVRSPLRITLGGGGTDLPSYARQFGGCCLTAAIDQYVYVAAIRPVLTSMHGLAHITGGGIAGNLVRVLEQAPECEAVIDASSWTWPTLFRVIADGGEVSLAEMRDVFNLGVGMVAVLPPDAVQAARAAATSAGVATWVCGEIRRGSHRVLFAD